MVSVKTFSIRENDLEKRRILALDSILGENDGIYPLEELYGQVNRNDDSLFHDFAYFDNFIQFRSNLYKKKNSSIMIHLRSKEYRDMIKLIVNKIEKKKNLTIDRICCEIATFSRNFKSTEIGKGCVAMSNFISEHKAIFQVDGTVPKYQSIQLSLTVMQIPSLWLDFMVPDNQDSDRKESTGTKTRSKHRKNMLSQEQIHPEEEAGNQVYACRPSENELIQSELTRKAMMDMFLEDGPVTLKEIFSKFIRMTIFSYHFQIVEYISIRSHLYHIDEDTEKISKCSFDCRKVMLDLFRLFHKEKYLTLKQLKQDILNSDKLQFQSICIGDRKDYNFEDFFMSHEQIFEMTELFGDHDTRFVKLRGTFNEQIAIFIPRFFF